MGRTLGPFTDVSTARVDGAYEIYRGEDEEGREVEILTLGSSSSKDPARRALLSDTVAWAHATRGPADASILSADLDSQEPYVVTLRQDGMRGVERMLERMLAMGPPAGPLSSGVSSNSGQFPIIGQPTGHIPIVTQHTDPHGIPRVVSTPPSGSPIAPASPMAPYVTKAQSSRPAWLVPLASCLLLLVLVAGGMFVFYGMSGEDGEVPKGDANTTSEETEDSSPSKDLKPKPEWNKELEPTAAIGGSTYAEGQGEDVALEGWPYAFKVTPGINCEATRQLSLTCDMDNGAEKPVIRIQVEECPGTCDNDESRNELVNEFNMPGDEQRFDRNTQVGTEYEGDTFTGGMTRFFTPEPGVYMFTSVHVVGSRAEEDIAEAKRIINSIATQTPYVEEE